MRKPIELIAKEYAETVPIQIDPKAIKAMAAYLRSRMGGSGISGSAQLLHIKRLENASLEFGSGVVFLLCEGKVILKAFHRSEIIKFLFLCEE